MSANSRQVAGQHYASKIQHWDYVLQALAGRYLEGNITKYVVRHRKKNGLQDLDKALHYLDKLIEEFGAGRVRPLDVPNLKFPMHDFVTENGLNSSEAFIIKRLAYWYELIHLVDAKSHVLNLRAQAIELENRMQAIKAGAMPIPGEEPGRGYINQG